VIDSSLKSHFRTSRNPVSSIICSLLAKMTEVYFVTDAFFAFHPLNAMIAFGIKALLTCTAFFRITIKSIGGGFLCIENGTSLLCSCVLLTYTAYDIQFRQNYRRQI